MYTLNAFATLALAVSASALVVPRATPPAGWLTNVLEPYDTYHTRYLALSCNANHDTDFFDQCCHPLLASESLETARPAQCDPANNDDSDLPFCDDDDSSSSIPSIVASPTSTKAPTPSPTTTPSAPVTTHTTRAKPSPKPQAAAQQPAAPPAPAPNTGGFATFFYQNNNAGACGTVHQDSDMIAAIDGARYGDLGARSGLCGKQVKITNTKNQKSVTVTIADACPTCENSNSIDLSVAAFKSIATLDEGMVPISWVFTS